MAGSEIVEPDGGLDEDPEAARRALMEIAQVVPDELRPKVERVESILIRHQKEHFEGPLPHPEIVAHYENILPGAAERLFRLAEEESTWRRERTKEQQDAIIADRRFDNWIRVLGQVFALVTVILSLAVVAYGMYTGNAAWAAGFGAVGIAALAGVFIVERTTHSRGDETSDGSN